MAAAIMEERLKIEHYDRKACLAAIKGESIPDALGHRLLRLCTIRGIRYHSNFGDELRGVLPEFTRALNARDIMANVNPDIHGPEDEPYCIWHPQVASEDTYRRLVYKYPSMVYQVGRACAVAGYEDLYAELDILPEIHIAEEARDSGCEAIYSGIVSKPVRYKIMDDYQRHINMENPQAANVDGNTCVRWMLDIKQKFHDIPDLENTEDWTDFLFADGFVEQTFNITEDMNIDITETSDEEIARLRPKVDFKKLLTEPLPRDLPTADKDLLIRMAAYHGDIDRYVRLRRPKEVQWETYCCVRGVYHNTMFAVWCSKQSLPQDTALRKAIEARFIMNNVLSRVTQKTFAVPYLIWYPTFAEPATYKKLAELRPEMLSQIVRACIVAGYKDLFNELVGRVIPDKALMKEAKRSSDAHYTSALKARMTAIELSEPVEVELWKLYTDDIFRRSRNSVTKSIHPLGVECSFDMLYNGVQCEAAGLELEMCLPDHWMLPEDDEESWRDLDYVTWPPQGAVTS